MEWLFIAQRKHSQHSWGTWPCVPVAGPRYSVPSLILYGLKTLVDLLIWATTFPPHMHIIIIMEVAYGISGRCKVQLKCPMKQGFGGSAGFSNVILVASGEGKLK